MEPGSSPSSSPETTPVIGLIHNDLVISILVVALLTAIGRLVLGVFNVGVEGAAVFVASGYAVIYLVTLLLRRLRAARRPSRQRRTTAEANAPDGVDDDDLGVEIIAG